MILIRVRDVPCTVQEFRQLTGGGNQTESFIVGLLIAPENIAPVPADTRASVLPILPVFRADIARFMKKRKRRREREEMEKKERREESQNVCTREKDGVKKKRKQRIYVRCNGTRARVEKMKLGRKDEHRRSVHPTKTRVQKSSSILRSHREEVAASEDPRANGDSTLKSANRDAFPLRELRASQQTGDV
ncbi:hypothetical protein V1477_015764 [Vespula maculifrons]|uniref:Uncharacterized protein n=1 Tax=Vespula maculifrons TaxID=7453 RepID=A0ABD2BB35_VESMC